MNRGKKQSILDKRANRARMAWMHTSLDVSETEARRIHQISIRAGKAAVTYRKESDKIICNMKDPTGITNEN